MINTMEAQQKDILNEIKELTYQLKEEPYRTLILNLIKTYNWGELNKIRLKQEIKEALELNI